MKSHFFALWKPDMYDKSKVVVGAEVVRLLAGKIGMTLTVDKIEDGIVTCHWWTFDLETGAEVDPDLNWGPPPLMTGSFLTTE